MRRTHLKDQNSAPSSMIGIQPIPEPLQEQPSQAEERKIENQLEILKEMNNLREDSYFRMNLLSVLERINKNLEELSVIRELLEEDYEEEEQPKRR